MLDTRARAADCNEYGWVLDDYDWWVSEEVRESRIKRSHALQRAKGEEGSWIGSTLQRFRFGFFTLISTMKKTVSFTRNPFVAS